ncbi:MAG TPA: hypothetical protein VFA95_10200 [Gammaproteobacteria bacterium]|nr:hypothetical protein [Gammaproteobacteria bacterium]
MTQPGRACPLDYRYGPEDVRDDPPRAFATVYVVGGLYGNVEALEAVFTMCEAERSTGREVGILFNGDFHWFDVAPADFAHVQHRVLGEQAVRGNVEAELASRGWGAGCGCSYPEHVDDATVARSNAIMTRLQATADRVPGARRSLGSLPRHAMLEVGGERVAVVHGDPVSLSGWQLALEALTPDRTLRERLGADSMPPTTAETLAGFFRGCEARVIACSHTCLPCARRVEVDGTPRLVLNNGAAGMPNFRGAPFGVISRLSADPAPPRDTLYGVQIGGVRCDAVPVTYPRAPWLERFVDQWPPGSPAHESYYRRLAYGTAITPRDADLTG